MTITLATLPKATAQEVFDQVVVHLITQGRPSKEGGFCTYLNKEGLKCAAGCLISKEEYTTLHLADSNRKLWSVLARNGVVPKEHVELITWLQQGAHDSWGISGNPLTDSLRKIATKYKLDTSSIQTTLESLE